jgi:DNA-binding MarR family transcriptional regulator
MERNASARRRPLLNSLDQVIRKATAQSVLLSEATAARAGLNSSDLECLDLLNFEGPSPPGRLAELTGLTTGAVTMLVDRLERAGFVRRTPNPEDRRSVLVEVLPASAAALEPLFTPLARKMARVNERYSDAELATVVDYLTRAYEAGAEHLRWLTQSTPVPAGRLRRSRSHRTPSVKPGP